MAGVAPLGPGPVTLTTSLTITGGVTVPTSAVPSVGGSSPAEVSEIEEVVETILAALLGGATGALPRTKRDETTAAEDMSQDERMNAAESMQRGGEERATASEMMSNIHIAKRNHNSQHSADAQAGDAMPASQAAQYAADQADQAQDARNPHLNLRSGADDVAMQLQQLAALQAAVAQIQALDAGVHGAMKEAGVEMERRDRVAGHVGEKMGEMDGEERRAE